MLLQWEFRLFAYFVNDCHNAVGYGLTESGIGKRLTYWILSRKFFGKFFDNLFSLACVALGPLIPSATVKTSILLPLGQSMLDSMEIKPYAETGESSNRIPEE